MKVADCLKRMNKSCPINSSRLLELKQYYISMYRYYMIKLYDNNFINDPTMLDKKQLYSNIVDMGIKGMVDSSGTIILTSERVEYAYYKNNDTVAEDFLECLYYTLKYREASHNLDLLYETSSKSISLNMILRGSKIVSRSGLKLNKSNLCAVIGSGYTLDSISIKDDLWNIAMKELGIPEDEWLSDGLLDSDLTHEQEVQCIDILLNGKTALKGKYSDKLVSWLHDHKWSSDNLMTLSKVGMLDYIYFNMSEVVLSAIYKVLNSVNPDDIVAIVEDTVYLKKKMEHYVIPISSFAIKSGYPEEIYTVGPLIYGYVGEGYTKEYLCEEDIRFMGIPVSTYTDEGELIYLYDREQVSINCPTWFKENGDIYFEKVSWSNPFKSGSLPYKLFEICKEGQNGALGVLEMGNYTYKDIQTAKNKVMNALLKLAGDD